MEGHISQHDLAISGTSVAVQNLDQKTLAAVADLRGRVARYRHRVSHHSAAVGTKSEQNVVFLLGRKTNFFRHGLHIMISVFYVDGLFCFVSFVL